MVQQDARTFNKPRRACLYVSLCVSVRLCAITVYSKRRICAGCGSGKNYVVTKILLYILADIWYNGEQTKEKALTTHSLATNVVKAIHKYLAS